MGRLISFDADFKIHPDMRRSSAEQTDRRYDPEWFFEKTVESRINYSSYASWDIQHNYPVRLGVHNDVFSAHAYHDGNKEAVRRIKIEIRKFVERTLTTDVIWRTENMSYYLVYPPNPDGVESYQRRAMLSEIRHGYMVFYLETDAEAMLFKLRFADLITDIVEDHPETPQSPHVMRTETRSEAQHYAFTQFGTYLT